MFKKFFRKKIQVNNSQESAFSKENHFIEKLTVLAKGLSLTINEDYLELNELPICSTFTRDKNGKYYLINLEQGCRYICLDRILWDNISVEKWNESENTSPLTKKYTEVIIYNYQNKVMNEFRDVLEEIVTLSEKLEKSSPESVMLSNELVELLEFIASESIDEAKIVLEKDT